MLLQPRGRCDHRSCPAGSVGYCASQHQHALAPHDGYEAGKHEQRAQRGRDRHEVEENGLLLNVGVQVLGGLRVLCVCVCVSVCL